MRQKWRSIGSGLAGAKRMLQLLGCALALSTVACDTFAKLRATFHPEENRGPAFGTAGVRVTVTPPDGITILLDDIRVASLAPYSASDLKPGRHILEVRAMGYHPVRIPIELLAGEVVEVPVTLRSRFPTVRKATPQPVPEVSETQNSAPPPPIAPEGRAPELPIGVEPILLKLVATPPADLEVDGRAVEEGRAALRLVSGVIRCGGIDLGYRITASGMLILSIPEDGATWSKDGRPLPKTATFQMHHGALRVGRAAKEQGSEQVLMMMRQEEAKQATPKEPSTTR